MSEQADIAIVGAGAAGLAAAIFAAESAAASNPQPRIVLLDGAKTIGAKILVAGGGRCNVTHHHVTPDDYHGNRTIIRNVLAAFNEQAAVRWMESMGVQLKREETGKLFPVTDSARTVLDALLRRLRELRVELWQGCRVSSVKIENAPASRGTPYLGPPDNVQPRFVIHHSLGELAARSVILCTGGRSLPRTGSDGAGWNLAKSLGHIVTATHAALVPLVLDDAMFHANVSGLSHEAELSTFVNGKRVDRRTGSLLWTHFGISGPVVMDASRFWVIAHDEMAPSPPAIANSALTPANPQPGKSAVPAPMELRCSFFPGQSFEQVEAWLIDLSGKRPRLSIGTAISERFPERLADALLRHTSVDKAVPLSQLSRDHRRKIVHALTALSLRVKRDRGWNYAEVTAGGVPLEEIDFRTMASRKTPGLYLAGEILDCDGRIGGFNFQWAWATGYLAGRGAAGKKTGT